MTASGWLALLLHGPLMAGAAMLLAGILPWALARLAGQVGPLPVQAWRDWRRLLHKRPVVPEGASRLFIAAPFVSLAAVGTAALLVPSFSLGMATAPAADLLVVAGLLALSRAVLALAALDAGSAPGALGAAGVLRIGLVAEPALVVAGLTLAAATGSTNLVVAAAGLREPAVLGVPLLLTVLGLATISAALDETGATPFSGWHRAAAEAALALRRVVWLSVVAALVLPASLALPGLDAVAWLVAIMAWALKIALLAAVCTAGAAMVGQPALTVGAGALLVVIGVLFLLSGGDLA